MSINTTGFYDRNGIPIHVGDVVRSFHFHDATAHGKKRWLYHVVTLNHSQGGAVELVPLLETLGVKQDGGRCWMRAVAKPSEPSMFEVVTSADWPWDRPRLQQKASDRT